MEKYVRLNKTVANKGSLVPIEVLEDSAMLKDHLKEDPNADWYTSIYYYSKEAKEYFDKNDHSIKGYNGPAFSNKLVFDFDSKVLDEAKQDSITLLTRLLEDGVDIQNSSRVYFSGSKGFHVEIPVNKEFTPDELKSICTNIAGDLKTFDSKVYNTTRLFRLQGTRHQETGLYKTELEPNDLNELSIDEIKKKASFKTVLGFTPKSVENLAFLDKYKVVTKPKVLQVVTTDTETGINGLDTIDFTQCPRTTPRCIYALSKGIMVPGEGERNAIFFRLAAYYKNQGHSKEETHGLLKGIARNNSLLYPNAEPFKKQEIWNTVLSSVYSPSANWKAIPGAAGTDKENPTIKRYCDAIGKHTSHKCCLHTESSTNDKTTMEISEVFDSFKVFAENFDKNIVRTGINFVDDNMKIATGTSTLLVGAAGSGKTTASLNMLELAGQTNQQNMFFSMDMHRNMVYLKLAQKLTNYSQEQIFDFHRTGNKIKIGEIKEIIALKYKNTLFDFSSTLTLDQMQVKILDAEQKTGNKMKLVITDYASRISGPHSDTYANARYNALKSKEVADITDVASIILSQISRNTGDGGTPIRTKRAAKESGDWEESASNVITMWRPFMGDHERDDVVRFFLAKNRMGPELEGILHWDGAKGLIRDMSDQELMDYNALRGENAEREYLKLKAGKSFT